MAGQQIERLDFADRSFDAGFYFQFSEGCRRTAAAIVRTVANVIRPPDQFFGSYPTAASFTPAELRFAWVGVMAGIAGMAVLLLLGWSEIGAGPVSATEPRTDRSSSLAAAPQVETQADRMDAIRRRGQELLRTNFPEDEPSPSLARGDRLEVHDSTIKPVMRIATAGDNEGSVVAPSAPLPAPPAASKPAEAKEKSAAEKRPAHRSHAKRDSSNRRDRVMMARAKYVQVPGAPQVALGGGLQPNRAPPEENKVFGWVTRLPDAIVPSSWKSGWDNLWARGNGR
jgi:hypothetical protein